ncbi:MAG: hypothetical protein ABIH65_04215 [Nanoarchaeota archaeon]
MKKGTLIFSIIFLMMILVVPSILAIDITVKKTSSDEVYVKDTEKPIVFYLTITNSGQSDNFEFYNLAGFSMIPTGKTSIAGGESKEIKLELTPLAELPDKGYYTITCYIRDSGRSEIEQTLTFKIIELKDAFLIGSSDINIESTSTDVYIKNNENFDFGNINVKFSSPFFNVDKSFILGPKETKSFTIQLNKEDFKNLTAGFYTMTADVSTNGKEATTEGIVKFIEKNIVTTTKKNFGFFINTQVIEKKNEGNIIETSETVIKKNIISRLFTSFSPEPDLVEREGLIIYYTWVAEVSPGEIYSISVKTNWLFPFLVIVFLIAIVLLMKQYTLTNLVLSKRVSFVKAKGGEFALKVSILVHARKYIERINIIDRLPHLVEIYDRFGGEQPSKIDKKNKRVEWSFEKLEAGETRVLSYIIYSKVGVLGKFALPTATALYEREGDIHEAESNHAFFIAEQRTKDLPEE